MDWMVVWLPDTENELAELWLASTDRERITVAADQIDMLYRPELFLARLLPILLRHPILATILLANRLPRRLVCTLNHT